MVNAAGDDAPLIDPNAHPVDDFRTITGVVVSSNTTTPGPASTITYTVRVNLPEGPVEFAGTVPAAGTRLPDSINVVPAKPGTPIFLSIDGPTINYMVYEAFQTDTC